MKTSFWRRWYQSFGSAKKAVPVAPAGLRRPPLDLESLEERVTPTLTPQMIMDINTNTLSSNASGMVAIGSTTYFIASDDVYGIELWKSDGTDTGTAMVKDINLGGSSNPGSLTNVDGTLFLKANDGTHGQELWKSNGTAAGTVLVKDICPGVGPSNLTNVNGTLF